MGLLQNKLNNFREKVLSKREEEEETDNLSEASDKAENSKGLFEEENYSYTPQGSFEAPEYQPYKKSQPELNVVKKSSNIYKMNEAAAGRPKYHFQYRVLNDIFDAVNIANLICEKNTLVLVSFEKLTEDVMQRINDFLDGVSYAEKSYHCNIKNDMVLYIPDGIELHGDFLTQVDIFSTRGV